MMQPESILSSRRSYEFRADEIKLSLLCIRGVVEAIKSNFGFELGQIGAPTASFGRVANTSPPGLVFALGVSPFPEDQGTPIRSIQIDSRRIVVDVAGPSRVIEPTFLQLKDLVKHLRTSEDAPAIPDFHDTRDYSELVVQSPFLLARLFNPRVLQVIAAKIPMPDEKPHSLVGSARFRLQELEEEYPGSNEGDVRNVHLDLRAGTSVDDGMIFSGAPLDSDAHLALIEQLMQVTSNE